MTRKADSRHSIGLVACCAKKLDEAAPARDLYQSQLFILSRAYVETRCDEWAILSAKHGLVMPDQAIEPYNLSLHDLTIPERRDWARRVAYQISDRYRKFLTTARFIVLAGASYRRPFRDVLDLGDQVEIPLQGLGIGKQVQWLIREQMQWLKGQLSGGVR